MQNVKMDDNGFRLSISNLDNLIIVKIKGERNALYVHGIAIKIVLISFIEGRHIGILEICIYYY